jgi:hypothetical protein
MRAPFPLARNGRIIFVAVGDVLASLDQVLSALNAGEPCNEGKRPLTLLTVKELCHSRGLLSYYLRCKHYLRHSLQLIKLTH